MFGFKKKHKTPKTPKGTRYYGGTGTIHSNGSVDVLTDSNGIVVAVWFRCQLLPFTDHRVDESRAKEMRDAYAGFNVPSVEAVVFRDV